VHIIFSRKNIFLRLSQKQKAAITSSNSSFLAQEIVNGKKNPQ